MKVFALVVSLLLVGCASAPLPAMEDWSAAEDDACEGHDRCVALVCADDLCGLYHCEDTGVLLARGGIRPPVSSAAPGSGPRRNWGSARVTVKPSSSSAGTTIPRLLRLPMAGSHPARDG